MKSSMWTKTAVSGLAFALLLTAVTACGGGSGGGLATTGNGGGQPGTPVSQPPLPPPDSLSTDLQAYLTDYASDPEYRRNWGLGQIDAATAYARIAQRDGEGTAPGAGARVAVIDTGIDLGHWEFNSGRISRTNPAVVGTVPTHGTAVASVIAAQRNGREVPSRLADYDFHGVAWGVERLQVMSVALGRADPDEPYRSIGSQSLGTIVEGLADRVSGLSETDFVNMSFGHRGLIENYAGVRLGPRYAAAVGTLAQANAGPDNGKTILIFAAGNAYGRKCSAPEPNCVNGEIVASSPELYAGLPVLEASLRDHVVAAVATDENGRIASFSNRCGIAAKWCIAAPGDNVPVAYYGPRSRNDPQLARGYSTSSGTSFAAPFVTGGLAVLKHLFRSQLTNESLLTRLYETARVTPDVVASGRSCPAHLDLDGDLSDCELSSTLGRGLMDLGAAAAPIGTMYLALNGGWPAQSSQISGSPAIGDGMRLSLAGQDVAVFDSLGAPFWIDAGRFVGQPAPAQLATRVSRWLAERDSVSGGPPVSGSSGVALAEGVGPAGSSFHLGFGAPGDGHMSLAPRSAAAAVNFGNVSLSSFAATGSGGEAGTHSVEAAVHGLALAWRPADEPVGLHTGWIRETDTLYGSSANGAFGSLSSSLNFLGASGTYNARGWRLDMAAEFGRAMPEAAGGLLAKGGEHALSTAFSASAERPLGNGRFRLSVQQPLRVESGSMSVSLPVGRTPKGTVLHRQVALGLEPSGRQVDFGVDWTQEPAPGAVWRIGAVLSREPDHITSREAETILLAGLRVSL